MRHGYIQYGVGLTKSWKDNFKSYLQVVVRNGGRTGVGFQLGLNIMLGKDKPIENVKNISPKYDILNGSTLEVKKVRILKEMLLKPTNLSKKHNGKNVKIVFYNEI